jgi:predicted Rdx family selenoprotein
MTGDDMCSIMLDPRTADFECLPELELIVDRVHEGGFPAMRSLFRQTLRETSKGGRPIGEAQR